MSRKCSICSHPNKIDAEREYFQGKSVSGIARRYSMSPESLRCHLRDHTSRQMAQAYKKKQEVESLDLFNEIDDLVERTKKILDRAESKEHDLTALKAIAELRGTYQLMLQIAVALHQTKQEDYEKELQEESQERTAEMVEKMKILTPEEQKVFRMLLIKIDTKTETIDPLESIRLKITASTQRTADEQYKDTGEGEKPQEIEGKQAVQPDKNNSNTVEPEKPGKTREIPPRRRMTRREFRNFNPTTNPYK